MIFYDKKLDISHRLITMFEHKNDYEILIATLKKTMVQQGFYMVFCSTLCRISPVHFPYRIHIVMIVPLPTKRIVSLLIYFVFNF